MTKDLIGQQLGNYRLVSLLGRGGFAEVYLAQHVRLSMQAAIKVLHAHLSPEEINEFEHEAETIANLLHPHIVRVLDFNVFDGIPFLVMDYCPDGTLRQRHSKGVPIPLSIVVSYVKQVADALQYIHDQKLIHRDIKPANMLIGRHSDILLSDFGIASTAHSTYSMKTQTFTGTAPYMAPEQIKRYPRKESDQYALAVVTYQWLTGELPFIGTPEEIVIKHLAIEPPSLCQKLPNLSVSVEKVVFRALTKDPHQRFATVQAFATALKHASQTKPSVPTPTQPNTAPFQPISSLVPAVLASPVTPVQAPAEMDTPAILSPPPMVSVTVALPNAQAKPQPSMTRSPMPKQSSSPSSAAQHIVRSPARGQASLPWSVPLGEIILGAIDEAASGSVRGMVVGAASGGIAGITAGAILGFALGVFIGLALGGVAGAVLGAIIKVKSLYSSNKNY